MINSSFKNWPLARRKNALQQRARIIRKIRQFFSERGYLEVETPHRIPAPAPESHIDAVPSGKWFLHTSPELCMKRMLAAGYEKIFQICRCWREGERGSQHIPEFTLLEWYRADGDYLDLMDECEKLIQSLAVEIGLGESVTFRDHNVLLTSPWERITVEEAFNRYAKIPAKEALKQDLFDELMVSEIEPRLGTKTPTFIYDYPSERRSLARLKKEDPAVAERFELYLGGLEIANAFSELIDMEEQRKVFQVEAEVRRSLEKSIYPMPEKFLGELENLSPSAGIALGVDRLVMVLLNARTIDEVVAFSPEEL
ncbi:MAG: EF-P lysine aminoacylase EpmA [Thermodesulfobacteriota bacterium]|nr:EF-P lysine aminoacylase EpmA [Thermodesulfobacteriota bacterium]